MQQAVDLQNDPGFQALDVAVVSIAFDSADEQAAGAQEYGIQSVPMLVDDTHAVSELYDVLQWAVRTGEPGHTFILIDAEGMIAWIKDYGAPENGGLMYVPVEELAAQIAEALNR
jgi:peroxiredoxin